MPGLTEIVCECGYRMRVPSRALGKTFTCMKCKGKIPTHKPDDGSAEEGAFNAKVRKRPGPTGEQGAQEELPEVEPEKAEQHPAGFEDANLPERETVHPEVEEQPPVEPPAQPSVASGFEVPEELAEAKTEMAPPYEAGFPEPEDQSSSAVSREDTAAGPYPEQTGFEEDGADFAPPEEIHKRAADHNFAQAPQSQEPAAGIGPGGATYAESAEPEETETESDLFDEDGFTPAEDVARGSSAQPAKGKPQPPQKQAEAQQPAEQPQAAKPAERTRHKTLRDFEDQKPKRRIGELLLDAELITENQLQHALQYQKEKGGKLAEVLIELDYLDVKTFVNFLSKQPGIASIELPNYEIPNDLIEMVPREFAIKHELLPIDRLGRHLTVGMACPLDSRTVGELEEITGLKVRPLLCNVSDIRGAIERYYYQREDEGTAISRRYGFSQAATGKSEHGEGKAQAASPEPAVQQTETDSAIPGVADLVTRLDMLRTTPETIERAEAAMEDPAGSATVIADLVSKDPPVAARLLSMANSDKYGFSNKVLNVTMAASLLGLRDTYSLISSTHVLDSLQGPGGFDYLRFWERSQLCARLASGLGIARYGKEQKGAWAAGLLYAIGRLALIEVAPDLYEQVGPELEGQALMDKEKEVIGTTYPEAGYILAESWQLPAEIADPIRLHRNPEQAPEETRDMVVTTALAAAMADNYEPGAEDQSVPFDELGDLLDLAGLSEHKAAEVFNNSIEPAEE